MIKMISVITPAFNSVNTLEECLLSVCHQAAPVEHIVIDGGSTDGTLALLKKYENRYNLRWISEPDRGIADAMNKGFLLAQGEVVAWLDADNFYREGVIAEIMSIFNQHNVDIVYGNVDLVDHVGMLTGTYYPPEQINLEQAVVKFTGAIPPQPGVFFRRQLFHSVNGFDVSYKVAGDIDFWIKVLSRQPKILYCNKTMGAYRLEEQGASRSLRGMKTGLKEMMAIYKPYMRPVIGRLVLAKKYLASYLLTAGRFHAKKIMRCGRIHYSG